MTSLEGRVLRRRRTIAPPAGARSELEVFAELARRLGARRRADRPRRGVRRAGPRIRGWDRGLLRSQPRHPRHRHRRPLAVPGRVGGYSSTVPRSVRAPGRPCAPGARPTDGTRAGAAGVGPVRSDELTLVTGRLLEHYQSGAQTRRVPELLATSSGATVELHRIPRHGSASRWAISSRCVLPPGLPRDRGRHDGIRFDTVFMPFHFPGHGSANRVTSPTLTPSQRCPSSSGPR